MMVLLAAAIRRLDADPAVGALVLTGRGRAFCSGVDLTAAEEVFKGDVKDVDANPVAQMERCRKPIIGAVNGFAVTAGFEIALACDILVAGKDAKFIDTTPVEDYKILAMEFQNNEPSPERAHSYYNGMTKGQFAAMQKFISSRSSKSSKL
ncbi:Enoyl-CoA hydratase/isomerase family [Musa troglodytarum]|uniref:Enoyl-CoA hydratase/isomerase family n=1 Tax=Musa troglodytarum TaxID=320322 RepID=A0A9E7EQ70_9LILI|nr:Enoyl-CoA hydratase/isomerase family [Musa troglodytarum]